MRLSGTKATAIHQYRGLGNQLWDLAGNRPSLDLRFAESKSLVDATTGSNLATFTRASGGTYIGSDGLIKTAATNEPRFDHSPATGESLGLLIEEQRANLLLRSEEFDDPSWAKGSSTTVTANQGLAPNGTNTADRIVMPLAAGTFVQQSVAVVSGTTYTFSLYAKATTATSTVVLNAGNGTTGEIPLGSSWQRIVLSTVATSSSITVVIDNGDRPIDVLVWGAQLEAGSFPTSYIPTTASAVTRAADVASISGSNFSSWYRQSEGTVFTEFGPWAGGFPDLSSNYGIIGFSDGSYLIGVHVFAGSGISPVFSVQNAGTQAYLSSGVMTPSVTNKIAGTYKANDFARSENGTSAITDTTGTVPIELTRVDIGKLASIVNQLNGTIRRITYWPQRLSNETLESITQ